MKKVIFGGVILMLTALGLTFYFVNKESVTEDILSSSIKVGQLAVKTRVSSDVVVKELPSNVNKQKIKTLLESQIQSYKEVGNTRFDVVEFKNSTYGDTSLQDSETGSAPNAELDSNDFESIEEEDLPTDSRVVKKGKETAYMLVKDFNFDESGVDYVQYEGIVLEIPKTAVPESYEDMKLNPDNIYDYVKYEKQDKYIDVLFESVRDGINIIVRVYNDGKRVTSYEVL